MFLSVPWEHDHFPPETQKIEHKHVDIVDGAWIIDLLTYLTNSGFAGIM